MEIVIVGGGPSCGREQIARAIRWSKAAPKRHLLAVNKSIFEVPVADYGFSRDTRFINKYYEELSQFEGQFIVGNGTITPPWARRIDTTAYISGAAAIEAAARMGYLTIYLLGADGHTKGGDHWHTNYTDLPNVPNVDKFDEYYADAMANCQGVEVYNLSPGTSIESVPTMDESEVWQVDK